MLEAVARTLDLDRSDLELSWHSMGRVGNLSSSAVLHVLADTLAAGTAPPGGTGVLFAMGPGICAELVLLRFAEG